MGADGSLEPESDIAEDVTCACSSAPGWPIVLISGLLRLGSLRGFRARTKVEQVCKVRLCVRNAICPRAGARATAIAAIVKRNKVFAYAWTAYTIAPIAVKRAKLAWRILMATEPVRIAFRLDRDPLLLGVLRSAVEFQACQAGLDAETGAQFARASVDVCRETLSKPADPERLLEVTLDTFPDRIELAIHCAGEQMPAVGLETFACSDVLGRGGLNGLELLSRVDRVLYVTEEGVARTTLVKLLRPKG